MGKTTQKKSETNVVNQLSKLVDTQKKPNTKLQYECGDVTFSVEVKGTIPFTERLAMERDIVDMVFVSDEIELASYQPSLFEFAKRFSVLAHYTGVKLPSNTDGLWDILNSTIIYQDVLDYVGKEIIDIFGEATKAIETRRDYIVHNGMFSGLINKATALFDKFQLDIGNLNTEQIIETFSKLPNISESAIVDGILKKAVAAKGEKTGEKTLDTQDTKKE